jgi:heavy metal sensor kinase
LKRRISISLRLSLWFGAVFFAGWALFGISMWANLSSTLKHEREQTLTRRLDRLQQLLIFDQKASPEMRYRHFVEFAHATGHGLIAIDHTDGTPAYPSPGLDAALFPWPRIRVINSASFAAVQLEGEPYWVMTRTASIGGQSLVLMAAAPEAGNLLVMERFLWGLLASAPILLLISSAGGYWVSRRALQAVDRITVAARSISIHNISGRIPVSRNGDELERLAETCNAMLDRLEASVNQIKRFTADASHELRGPLSVVRTVAEVALRNPRADASSRGALQEIVNETANAASLLEDMLTLARADALPVSRSQASVELATLLEEVCATAQPRVMERGLTLRRPESNGMVRVLGDAGALKRLLWILLDNAVKYSRAGGSVEVSLSVVSRQPQIVVSDDGIGISAADLPRIFDRFYRADDSRGIVEGSGLGLAIARWIADSHHAVLQVSSEEDVGTSFKIVFPAEPVLEFVENNGKHCSVKPDATPAEHEQRSSFKRPHAAI